MVKVDRDGKARVPRQAYPNDRALSPRLRGGGSRRFSWLVALSVFLHLALSPVPGWLGLFSAFFWANSDELPPAAPLETIPVELVSDFAGEEKVEPTPAEATPPVVAPSSTPPLRPPLRPPPETKKEAKKTESKPDAKPEVSPAKSESKPEPEPGKRPGGTELPDPSALTGEAGKVADANANVQLLIYNEPIRAHALGRRLGALLAVLPQWHSFLEPTGVDPIQDLDTIFVAGPELRRSGDVVAVLGHHLEESRAEAVIATLVDRHPKGRWLRRGNRPAARAWADRAQRLFVVPSRGMLMIAPLSAEKSALSVRLKPFPKRDGNRALIAKLKTPWRALLGTGIDIPHSIELLRLELTPIGEAAAELRLSARDSSAAAATRHARELTRLINQLTAGGGWLFFLFGEPLLDPIELQARDREIHGQVLVRPTQLDRLLNLAESWVEANTGRSRTAPLPSGAPGVSREPPSLPVSPALPSAPVVAPAGSVSTGGADGASRER